MSFKREGDDRSLLGVLRQRRVKELFAENIPEDEAQLLCNGLLSCTVCSYHPVFNTVSMLAIHRSGKKHQANARAYELKNQELRALIRKRRHEQYLKTGTTDIPIASSVQRKILTAKVYDPRVKKSHSKFQLRKPRLDLFPPSSKLANGDLVAQQGGVGNAERLPPNNARPYTRRCEQGVTKSVVRCSTSSSNSPPLSDVRNFTCRKTAAESKEFRKRKHQSPQLPSFALPHGKARSVTVNPQQNFVGPDELVTKRTCMGCHVDGQRTTVDSQFATEEDRRKKAKVYFHLRGSGWKKDWVGNWVQDEDAEFDTDEEVPCVP